MLVFSTESTYFFDGAEIGACRVDLIVFSNASDSMPFEGVEVRVVRTVFTSKSEPALCFISELRVFIPDLVLVGSESEPVHCDGTGIMIFLTDLIVFSTESELRICDSVEIVAALIVFSVVSASIHCECADVCIVRTDFVALSSDS